MPRTKNSYWLLPLILVICSLLGGMFGARVPEAAVAAESAPDASTTATVATFTKFLATIDHNFADPLDADKAIYKGAIPGMLRTLDPHSNFFDPKAYQELRDDQKGSYFGVGMHVASRGGKTVVVSPFPGSPAYKAGLRPGDIIVLVNDTSTEGLTTSDVADLLKGPRNTQVRIAVSREGAPDLISFQVTRDEIRRKSVPDGFFVKPNIAYVKILSFGENTAQELEENLKRLNADGKLEGLVLDLRDNPGGLLNAGVAVADQFLPKNSLIVSHHGRTSREKPYFARIGNHGANYPIVVLVNRSSASAAEIVTGAMQDHDRAWVMGETTFGKGLVQTVFPMMDNTALALTIARYYTPSGRLIQRDYSKGSFYDYYYRKDENARNPLDVKMTDSGRTVYGGGGITPDEKVEVAKLDHLETELLREHLYAFTRVYFSKHKADLPKGWLPTEATLSELHNYLIDKGVQFAETDYLKDRDWIRRYLAREMYTAAFDEDASDRIFAQTDPLVQKAIDSMPKAVSLVQNARKQIVQRMQGQPATPIAQR